VSEGGAAPFLDDEALRALARAEIALAVARRGGEGARRAGHRGGRVEFAGHRAYAPGDDVRTIDWGAHARTGRLVVKEFENEEGLDVVLVVDASASMALSAKHDAARRLAWALGWVALRGGARVRAATASDGALTLSEEVSGAGGAASLRDVLSHRGAAGGTRLSASLAKIPAAARGARLVVVLSDLLAEDDGRRALAAMSERGDDVVVVHVHASADLAAADGAEVLLEDAETGERVAADAGAAERAREFAARNEEEWRVFAARRRMRYVPVDAAAPFDAGMVRTLRAAGILA
jgi:uncharacterized protein (DUF58 family)